MHVDLRGASPLTNLMEVKVSKAQGRSREAGSEGSVEQKREPTNRNWMSGVRVGRAGLRQQSPYPSRTRNVNSSGCAPKVDEDLLTPGDLVFCLLTGKVVRFSDRRPGVRRERSRWRWIVVEGLNNEKW